MTDKEYNDCVDRYSNNVYRFILKSMKHEEDARDIVQSAFEKLWMHRSQVDFESCKSYLFTVAYNQMLDVLRVNKRVQLPGELDAGRNVTRINHTDQIRKTLREALDRLNHTQKSLVILKDYEGYNYDEIGKIMDLAPSQVKVYLHRARLKLREYLVSPENVM